jgi:MarR family transcriptional regulator, organic hydroperoxide resistance regulator
VSSSTRMREQATPDGPSIAQRAWAHLGATFMVHRERMAAAAGVEGLTFGQAKALGHLVPGQPGPMRELADSLRCDASQLTDIVDRLEALGLAERRVSTTDRRVREVVLTPEGAEVQARVQAAMFKPPDALLALSEREQRMLLRIGEHLVELIDDDALAVLPLGLQRIVRRGVPAGTGPPGDDR